MRSGQSQIVTAVLITGVLVALVSASYFWGVHLINKQRETVDVNNMERFMKNLDEKIQRVATSGGTERLDNIALPGDLKLTDNQYSDTISISFHTTEQIIATNATIHLVGDERDVAPVTEEAGLVTAFSEKEGSRYRVDFTLRYRQVISGNNANVINLVSGGRNLAAKGTHSIIVTNTGSSVVAGAGADGRDLFVTDVTVRFE